MSQFYYKSNRLQQLRGFCCTAQFGNISKAAKYLKLSHASVSVQIKSLERDLGVKLFDRNGPKITLTLEGKKLLKISLPLVNGLDQIEDTFKEQQLEIERTEISIAANMTSLNFILPKVIKKFLLKNQSRFINIHYAEYKEAIELLRSKEIEVAILPKREHKPYPTDLSFIPKWKFKPALITRADHPLAKKKNLTVKEISKYELTLPPEDLRVIPNLYEIFPSHNIDKRLKVNFHNWETTRKYIEAGIVISISSDVIIEENDQLVATSLRHLFDDVVYGYVVVTKRKPSENLQDLLTLK
jgi:DNA-binding transcriptional LysR family regulator